LIHGFLNCLQLVYMSDNFQICINKITIIFYMFTTLKQLLSQYFSTIYQLTKPNRACRIGDMLTFSFSILKATVFTTKAQRH